MPKRALVAPGPAKMVVDPGSVVDPVHYDPPIRHQARINHGKSRLSRTGERITYQWGQRDQGGSVVATPGKPGGPHASGRHPEGRPARRTNEPTGSYWGRKSSRS